MRLYIFKSESKPGLGAFAGDWLPSCYTTWGDTTAAFLRLTPSPQRQSIRDRAANGAERASFPRLD